MQGLAAISANNGWAMALVGACIVMTGLTTLSIIISQLHRIIALFEKKERPQPKAETAEVSTAPVDLPAVEDSLLLDLDTTANIYLPLTAELGETFGLAQLYALMDAKKLPHPHITVRELRQAGYLVPAGEGKFSWKNN